MRDSSRSLPFGVSVLAGRVSDGLEESCPHADLVEQGVLGDLHGDHAGAVGVDVVGLACDEPLGRGLTAEGLSRVEASGQ